MKHLLLCICLIFTNISFAQSYNIGLNATVIKNFEGFKENETVTISHIIKEVDEKPYLMKEKKENYFLLINNKTIEIPPQFDKYLRVNIKTPQDLWNYKIITDVIPELSIAGTQYELREEVEEEALDYINYLKEHNLVFNDPYLETYLYSLVTSIAPVNISDGRPGNVNIIILDSPTLNACIYPNGTIVINTGLLANLHTEDELVAILAHEIAHFIADHSIQNIQAEINRKKTGRILERFSCWTYSNWRRHSCSQQSLLYSRCRNSQCCPSVLFNLKASHQQIRNGIQSQARRRSRPNSKTNSNNVEL